MNALGSSAASFSGTRACARHPDMLGPRFCTDCGTSLCAACARHKPHKRCPSCNEAAGEKKGVADATWFAHLFVDSLLLSWKRARVRVFSIVMLTGLFAAVSLSFFFTSIVTPESEDGLLLLLLPSLALLLGVLAAPALEVPLTAPIPLRVRLPRAVLGSLLPLFVVSLVVAVPGWVSFRLIDSDSVGLVMVGVLVLVGVVGTASTLLFAFVYPIQAFVALRGVSPLRAFVRPFRAGIGGVLLLVFAHAVLSFGSLSAVDTVSNVVSLSSLVSPWVGLLVGWPLCVAAGAVVLFGMGAFGAASLRYVEDRQKLR